VNFEETKDLGAIKKDKKSSGNKKTSRKKNKKHNTII